MVAPGVCVSQECIFDETIPPRDNAPTRTLAFSLSLVAIPSPCAVPFGVGLEAVGCDTGTAWRCLSESGLPCVCSCAAGCFPQAKMLAKQLITRVLHVCVSRGVLLWYWSRGCGQLFVVCVLLCCTGVMICSKSTTVDYCCTTATLGEGKSLLKATLLCVYTPRRIYISRPQPRHLFTLHTITPPPQNNNLQAFNASLPRNMPALRH